jgi:hypothetical protein
MELVVALLLMGSSSAAQSSQVASPADAAPTKPLSVGTTDGKTSGAAPDVFGSWLQTAVSTNGDSSRPPINLVPRWQLGMRINRELFGHLQLGAGASASRGHDAAAFLTQELGSGRDLSIVTPITPDSYATVWDTTFTAAVLLKSRGRVRVKAVGELWNPFSNGLQTAGNDGRLRGRAIRFGIVTVF